MILNADVRPYRDGAAAASDEDGRGVGHGRGYKAAPGWRQDELPVRAASRGLSGQTARHSHSTICAITSPNSSRAADQTSAETKLAIWNRQYGHLEYPGRKRHRGPQRSEKPADENARHTPFFHEGLAARQDLRIARQRPHLRDLFLVFEAEPVGDPIAQRCAKAAGNPDRPEADAAAPISAPIATSAPQAGTSSEMKASDSPNASSRTIGAAQA